jgi:hypothetical protein
LVGERFGAMRNVAILGIVCCAMVTLSSCDFNAAGPEEGSEVADPAEEARLEADYKDLEESKIEVVKLSEFTGGLSLGKKPGPFDAEVHLCGVRTGAVPDVQRAALREFVANEKQLFRSVRDAIYEYYRHKYLPYRGRMHEAATQTEAINGFPPGKMQEEMERVLPDIKRGDELDELVTPLEIYVHRPVNGVAKIGMTFQCGFDKDDGLGVRLSGSTVEAVGTSVEAMRR